MKTAPAIDLFPRDSRIAGVAQKLIDDNGGVIRDRFLSAPADAYTAICGPPGRLTCTISTSPL